MKLTLPDFVTAPNPRDPEWLARWSVQGSPRSGVELVSVPEPYEHARSAGWAMLSGLYVTSSLRGRGLAHALLESVTDYADQHRLNLWLYCYPYGAELRALNESELMTFYRCHGFRLRNRATALYQNEMVRRWRR